VRVLHNRRAHEKSSGTCDGRRDARDELVTFIQCVDRIIDAPTDLIERQGEDVIALAILSVPFSPCYGVPPSTRVNVGAGPTSWVALAQQPEPPTGSQERVATQVEPSASVSVI
jgi:hypothetical protein